MRKKSIVLLGIASLALAALVGGTWAVWTQELNAGNEFRTAYYRTELKEEFKSPENWKPGVETEKKVWLSNTGEVPVLTKAVINQNWIRREDVWAFVESQDGSGVIKTVVPPAAGQEYPSLAVSGDEADRYEFAAVINFNKEAAAVLRRRRSEETGIFDLPVVNSPEEAAGKWLLTSEIPDEDGNLTFYYMGVVEPGKETPLLIESVTMNPKARASILGRNTRFIKRDDGEYKQVTIDEINPDYGFDSAGYTLNVSMTTVQATKAAAEAVFSKSESASGEGSEREVVSYLANHIAESGVYMAVRDNKKLIFSETDGAMGYTTQNAESGTESGNWFMSFTKMVPGGIYVDQMTIENHSRKNYDMFMQIVPREQDDVLKDELLDLISMKIYYNDQLIYNGTATGAIDPQRNLMQEERPLGYYASGGSGKIRVELQLDSGLALDETGSNKYMDVLTKIDWKFMVQERPDPNIPTPVPSDNPSRYPSDNPSRTPSRGPDSQRTTSITDNDVPAASITIGDQEVPLAYIPDGDVPLAAVPKTGDEQPVAWILIAMLISGSLFVYLLARKRRQKESHE